MVSPRFIMEPAYYYDLDEAEPPPPLSSASYDESFYANENYGGNATPVAEASSDYDLMVGNMTRRQFLEGQVQAMLAGWSNHPRISLPWRHVLIGLYTLMILIGSTGNLMVIYVVARNPMMRTARNVFIVNLAISDLMLCLITMPLTLIEILYLTWQFGDIEMGCRMIGFLQATSVFVSTISITAIALDRRRLIVGSEQESPADMMIVILIVPVIWAVAFVMASPLAIWKTLESWDGWTAGLFNNDTEVCDYNATDSDDLMGDKDDHLSANCILKDIIMNRLNDLLTCQENLPEDWRIAFSWFTLLFQFLLPMITLCIAYYQICQTLRVRLEQRVRQRQNNNSVFRDGASQQVNNGHSTNGSGNDRRNSVLKRNDERRERNIMRLKRTIKLLCWIGGLFSICWLPFNLFNAAGDTFHLFTNLEEEIYFLLYSACHILGMSSACSNPIIYGFLNENFSKEFAAIGAWWFEVGRGVKTKVCGKLLLCRPRCCFNKAKEGGEGVVVAANEATASTEPPAPLPPPPYSAANQLVVKCDKENTTTVAVIPTVTIGHENGRPEFEGIEVKASASSDPEAQLLIEQNGNGQMNGSREHIV